MFISTLNHQTKKKQKKKLWTETKKSGGKFLIFDTRSITIIVSSLHRNILVWVGWFKHFYFIVFVNIFYCYVWIMWMNMKASQSLVVSWNFSQFIKCWWWNKINKWLFDKIWKLIFKKSIFNAHCPKEYKIRINNTLI